MDNQHSNGANKTAMANRLPQPAILVTGASSGIGKALVLHLDELGFRVFAAVRRDEDAERLRSLASPSLIPLILDVCEPASLTFAREQVTQAMGEYGLAGLVNNAGVAVTAPLECIPVAEIRELFEVNVFGQIAVTQAFLPLLRQAGGRVANISSVASLFQAPFHGPYAASKTSLNAFSNALRLELKPQGVSVSVVIVGIIHTPMWAKGKEASRRIAQGYSPQSLALYGSGLRRLGKFFMRVGERGAPASLAARKIARIFTGRRPKFTYYVGTDAYLFAIGDKLLHGRLRDWVVDRVVTWGSG